MNEQTGQILRSQFDQVLKKFVDDAEEKGQTVTSLTELEAMRMEAMEPSQRVPFWKNVKTNAQKKGTRR